MRQRVQIEFNPLMAVSFNKLKSFNCFFEIIAKRYIGGHAFFCASRILYRVFFVHLGKHIAFGKR